MSIKESLMNNPDIDLRNINNVNELTDDILRNISAHMENFISMLSMLRR